MATHYKLTYFPLKGRAECARYLFKLADVPFEEETIPFDQWPQIKESTPFASLPLLTIDGNDSQLIAQHIAIARYLAKIFGFLGKDTLEQAKADMLVDGTNELLDKMSPLTRAMMSRDETAARTATAEFVENHFKPYLDRYEKFLASSSSGWYVGTKMTWCDVYIGEFIYRVTTVLGDKVLANHPKIKDHVTKLHRIPAIIDHLANRPQYPF